MKGMIKSSKRKGLEKSTLPRKKSLGVRVSSSERKGRGRGGILHDSAHEMTTDGLVVNLD